LIGVPIVLVGAPIVLIGDPMFLVGAPIVLIGSPIILVGIPMVSVGVPIVLIGSPMVLVGVSMPEKCKDKGIPIDPDSGFAIRALNNWHLIVQNKFSLITSEGSGFCISFKIF